MEDKNHIKMLINEGYFTEEQKEELIQTSHEFEEAGIPQKIIDDAMKFASIKSQIKMLLVDNGYYVGNSNAAKMLREIANEWDD